MTLVTERPHPFEIIEGAHFGAEHMNDDVTTIDQNPVSRGEAFDPRRAKAAVLDAFGQLFGDGRNLAIRAARSDTSAATIR